MSKLVKFSLAAALVAAGTTSAYAARHHVYHHHYVKQEDRWFSPVHLEDESVPAKKFFEQMQTDGN
jgi:hypothetical protein